MYIALVIFFIVDCHLLGWNKVDKLSIRE